MIVAALVVLAVTVEHLDAEAQNIDVQPDAELQICEPEPADAGFKKNNGARGGGRGAHVQLSCTDCHDLCIGWNQKCLGKTYLLPSAWHQWWKDTCNNALSNCGDMCDSGFC